MYSVKLNREKLLIAMARACMGAQDICSSAEMPRPTVNNALSGRSILPETAGKIARALGVDVTEIMEDNQP